MSYCAFAFTVNSPVTASKPTWMVCSKSEGDEISGLSLSRSFFFPASGKNKQIQRHASCHCICGFIYHTTFLTFPTFFWRKHRDDLLSRLPLLRYWGQRARVVIGWLGVLCTSLAAHPDRGGGGLVLTHSTVTHLHTSGPAQKIEHSIGRFFLFV